MRLPAPRAESWFYLVLSVVLHVAYDFLLVTAYRHGDLGVSYPVARGSSPLLAAAVAAIVAGERLDALTRLGIVLACGGIFGRAATWSKCFCLPAPRVAPTFVLLKLEHTACR